MPRSQMVLKIGANFKSYDGIRTRIFQSMFVPLRGLFENTTHLLHKKERRMCSRQGRDRYTVSLTESCARVFETHSARCISVYTRRLSLCAHANENGIKLGNLNGQKTWGASRRRSPISCASGRESERREMGDKSKNARMQIKPDL